MKKVDGLHGYNDMKNTLPSHLGAFILSNSKRILKNLSEKSTDFMILVYTTEIPVRCI